jgi:hypothetical protein
MLHVLYIFKPVLFCLLRKKKVQSIWLVGTSLGSLISLEFLDLTSFSNFNFIWPKSNLGRTFHFNFGMILTYLFNLNNIKTIKIELGSNNQTGLHVYKITKHMHDSKFSFLFLFCLLYPSSSNYKPSVFLSNSLRYQ